MHVQGSNPMNKARLSSYYLHYSTMCSSALPLRGNTETRRHGLAVAAEYNAHAYDDAYSAGSRAACRESADDERHSAVVMAGMRTHMAVPG